MKLAKMGQNSLIEPPGVKPGRLSSFKSCIDTSIIVLLGYVFYLVLLSLPIVFLGAEKACFFNPINGVLYGVRKEASCEGVDVWILKKSQKFALSQFERFLMS
jgi:hypothetical protein